MKRKKTRALTQKEFDRSRTNDDLIISLTTTTTAEALEPVNNALIEIGIKGKSGKIIPESGIEHHLALREPVIFDLSLKTAQAVQEMVTRPGGVLEQVSDILDRDKEIPTIELTRTKTGKDGSVEITVTGKIIDPEAKMRSDVAMSVLRMAHPRLKTLGDGGTGQKSSYLEELERETRKDGTVIDRTKRKVTLENDREN
jgi:hypothetical protein